MHNVQFALEGAWRVMLAGLILGAGLPLLFALGIRSLAYGAGGEAEVHETGVTAPIPHPIGTVLGWICFVVVLLGVALGILYIVVTGFGDHLSFSHVYPTIVKK
jgi:hypothetical protein